jgi:AcrR family transcriptional regulator
VELSDNARMRERILIAAAKTFDEKRYQLTSIFDIANAAEVEQQVIDSHFKSKEEIALAIIEIQNITSQRRAEAIIAENRPAMESLLRISACLGQDLIEDPIIRVGTRLNTEVLMLSQPLSSAWQDWSNLVAVLLAKGIKEGDVKEDIDVSVFSNVISRSYFGTQLTSAVTANYADLMETTFEMWIVMLSACSIEDRRRQLFRAANEILLRGNTNYDSQQPLE